MGRAKKKMKKAQAPAAGINSLTPGLLERILSLLPLKPRTRLKCVSKTWRTAITNLRRRSQSSSSSSSGLVIFSRDSRFTPKEQEFYPVTFLATHDNGTCTQVKSFAIDDLESYAVKGDFPKQLSPLLADSHNGLLLLRDSYRHRVYLCDPLLPDPGGIAELLLLDCSGHSQCGFFFDPASSENQQWKIVTFTLNSASYDEGITCCHIFSPESNQWEEFEATILKPSHPTSSLRSCVDFYQYAPCVRSGRKLYWLFRRFIMVYDFDAQVFRVISLPTNHSRVDINLENSHNHRGLLWESEGRIHYCQTAKGGFCLWTYNHINDHIYDDDIDHIYDDGIDIDIDDESDGYDDDDIDMDGDDDTDTDDESNGYDDDVHHIDDDYSYDGNDDDGDDDEDDEDHDEDYGYGTDDSEEEEEEQNYWMFKRWVPFEMKKDVDYAIGEEDDICPVAFNDELQILYLHDQISTLYFYSFETQRLSKAWSHFEEKENSEALIMMGYSFPINILN